MDMKFHCDLCSYSCKYQSEFDKHTRSDKHHGKIKKAADELKNAVDNKEQQKEKRYRCDTCPLIFASDIGLVEHKAHSHNIKMAMEEYLIQNNKLSQKLEECKEELLKKDQVLTNIYRVLAEEKYVAVEKLRIEKDSEIKELRVEIKQLRTDNEAVTEKLRRDNEAVTKKLRRQKDALMRKLNQQKEASTEKLYVQVGAETKEGVRMNAFGYVRKNYNKCPPIKNFEEINLLGTDELTIAENAIEAYGKNKFHIYVGDVIIKVYKKEDPATQSLWSSDVTRLAYLLRTTLNKEIDWIKDDKGVKASQHIIEPALTYIKNVLLKHRDNLAKTMLSNWDKGETLKDQQLSAELVGDIAQNEFVSPILKYIAPSFKINMKTTKCITNEASCALEDKQDKADNAAPEIEEAVEDESNEGESNEDESDEGESDEGESDEGESDEGEPE
ncbi:MAG: hypothetical protein Hyperionvirus14_50 [Hyperionvirus sp.]|uniref:C2H2-type domain-containing protein n=1 Tax=Hyperionvirus sp. TaxID=2487770 RepID=A0A3G5ACH1_9VIRU|nr:MAG: hypothetical protein Hyperionvirus14_50 [Hyperionvirus sp.]